MDPAMWPEAWGYIPWLRDFYMIQNKRAVKHNLPALWLAYFLSCPFTDDGKKRQPRKITNIHHPSGVYPHTINLNDPSVKTKKFTEPDPRQIEPKAKRPKVTSPTLSSDDFSDEFEDPSKRKRQPSKQSNKKSSRKHSDSKPDDDQFKLPLSTITKFINNGAQARAYNNNTSMPDLTEEDSDSDNEEANTLYDNQASLNGANSNTTQTPAPVTNTQTVVQ
ncbi:hypothetical protein B484DRAFT_433777, partial [Ochromonadaceae sp. CCMP2298]